MNEHNQTNDALPRAEDRCPDDMTVASYLDGRATPEESAVLERHLARCARCAKAVRELRDILGQVSRDRPDPELVRQMADRAKKLVRR